MNNAELAGNITFKDIDTYLNVSVQKPTIVINSYNYKNYFSNLNFIYQVNASTYYRFWVLEIDGHTNIKLDASLNTAMNNDKDGNGKSVRGILLKFNDIDIQSEDVGTFSAHVQKFYGQYFSLLNDGVWF